MGCRRHRRVPLRCVAGRSSRPLHRRQGDSGYRRRRPPRRTSVETPDLDEDFAENLEEASHSRSATTSTSPAHRSVRSPRASSLKTRSTTGPTATSSAPRTAWTGPGKNPYAAAAKDAPARLRDAREAPEVALNNLSEFSLTEFFRTERGRRHASIHPRDRGPEVARSAARTGHHGPVGERLQPQPASTAIRGHQPACGHFSTPSGTCRAWTHVVAMRDLLDSPAQHLLPRLQGRRCRRRQGRHREEALPPVSTAIGPVPQDTRRSPVVRQAHDRSHRSGLGGNPHAARAKEPGVVLPGGVPCAVALGEQRSSTRPRAARTSSSTRSTATSSTSLRTGRCARSSTTRHGFEPTRHPSGQRSCDRRVHGVPACPELRRILACRSCTPRDVIDYLTSGISSSMLARRWNSPELLTLDLVPWRRCSPTRSCSSHWSRSRCSATSPTISQR